jgi:adenosylhomocysteine nucleosidase
VANVLTQSVDLGVVFALSIESGCFVDLLSEVRVTRGDGFTVRRGRYGERDVVLVESGPGRARAAKAAHALIDAYRPRLVASSGFAGGLDSRLKRFDLVAADSLVDTDGREMGLDAAMIAPWMNEVPNLHRGRLLTVDRIIRLSEEKRQLGAKHQAFAVDMESFAVAEVCREREVPLLVVRAISDAVDQELPADIGHLLAQKSFAGQLGAAVGSVFRRPGAAKDLFNLHQTALEASGRLAKFLSQLCTHHPGAPGP